MKNYFIESFKIDKLWGYQDINLSFHKDVNILIGPNGSGKTTVLNLLHSILTADIPKLLDVNFQQAEIKLREFKGNSVRTVTAEVNVEEGVLELRIGKKKFPLDADPYSRNRILESYRDPETGNIIRRRITRPLRIPDRIVIRELSAELNALVPLVWLPISRRLPVTENEEERYTRSVPLESVDLRLQELLEDLSRYHSRLNTLLSERYKDFEREVLSVILYSKEHDHLDSILSSIPASLPTETEKDQLREAFKDAGLLKSKQMRTRIDDHFAAAEEAGKRVSENVRLELEDILVLPLISRTKSMVEYARELEKYRNNIFAPLHLYENTVNSFLEEKTIKVDESNGLKIESSSKSQLNWRDLSSGEKQILILLTEVLLKVDEPVVYIADEPELSLHVTWQEKLLESIVTLGGQKQIIVATHSPDVVGKFRDNVITLGKES